MSRMLLVEDDEFGRGALRELFEEHGWDVAEAENGMEAMRLLAQTDFDVIVTDVFMPDMDGVELIRQIKVTKKSPKILAISGGGAGMGADNTVDIIGAIGADAALQKPVSNDELLRTVNELVGA